MSRTNEVPATGSRWVAVGHFRCHMVRRVAASPLEKLEMPQTSWRIKGGVLEVYPGRAPESTCPPILLLATATRLVPANPRVPVYIAKGPSVRRVEELVLHVSVVAGEIEVLLTEKGRKTHGNSADALPSLHQMRRIQVPILIVEGKTQRALASRDGMRRQDACRARRADFRLLMTYDASLLFL